ETIRPSIGRPRRQARRFAGDPRFLFLGSFTLPANVHSFSAFLDALPAVFDRLPAAKILVVGKNAENGIRAKAAPHGDRIQFLDYVPDISEVMSTAAAMVAPISFGTGIKMKVLEALAHGLPLVSSRAGIDGTGITPGQEALVSDDLGEYPEMLSAVLDHGVNRNMSEACLQLSETVYPPEAVSGKSRQIFMPWGTRGGGGSPPLAGPPSGSGRRSGSGGRPRLGCSAAGDAPDPRGSRCLPCPR